MASSSQPPTSPHKLRLPTACGRLVLVSPVVPQHDQHVKDLYESPSTRKFIRGLPAVWPIETITAQRLKRAANPTNLDFAIHLVPSQSPISPSDDFESLGPFVGVCNLTVNPLNSSAQAGIYICSSSQSQHYASEALHTLLSAGFSKGEGGAKLHRISFETAEDNVQMRGWMEKTLGVPKEYVHREAWVDTDGFLDLIGYSILEQEWSGEKGLGEKLRVKVQEKVDESKRKEGSEESARQTPLAT